MYFRRSLPEFYQKKPVMSSVFAAASYELEAGDRPASCPIIPMLEPPVDPESAALSLFIPLGVGILFAVYPARQAAFMYLVEALRHEWITIV